MNIYRFARRSIAAGIALGLTLTSSVSVAGDDGWERFPIMMINVRAQDVAAVAPVTDVVSYYTTFAPFESINGVSEADASKSAFRFDLVEDLLAAAEQHDVHVTVTPALLANAGALNNNDPLYRGDGTVVGNKLYVNKQVVPGCDNPGADPDCIEVPVAIAQVSQKYVDYWSAKLPSFFQDIVDADPGKRIWGIYGTEEIRVPQGNAKYPEYTAQRRIREAMDANGVLLGRPLMAYSPPNRVPHQLAYTVLGVPGTGGSVQTTALELDPASPASFAAEWSQPGCKVLGGMCQVLNFTDYYPIVQKVALDAGGAPIRIQDHLMRMSLVSEALGPSAHQNRIAAVHRMDVQRETLDAIAELYQGLGLPVPKDLAFHEPDFRLCSLSASGMTAAEARHDFWAGLHRGQGILLYNYQFARQALAGQFQVACPVPPVAQHILSIWNEYTEGLALIKADLRPYLVAGNSSTVVPFKNVQASVTQIIPGTEYLIDTPVQGADTTYAMPDYPALNGSTHRIGDVRYLIVTQSYAQHVSFDVPFGKPICSAEVVIGDGGSMSVVGNLIRDTIHGIDGRVYRIELDGGGGCN